MNALHKQDAAPIPTILTPEIPYRCCHCGCGNITPLAKRTNRCWGHIKGHPLPFIPGHKGFNKNGAECIRGDSRRILLREKIRVTVPMTRGFEAIIDIDDYDKVRTVPWSPYKATNGSVYAINPSIGLMHRFIMGITDGNIDHINHNGLDNCRDNMRSANKSQNAANRKKLRGSSKFKGVQRRYRKYLALIKKDYRTYYLGTFDSDIDAAKAYDAKARELFGEFACVNFPLDGERCCLG